MDTKHNYTVGTLHSQSTDTEHLYIGGIPGKILMENNWTAVDISFKARWQLFKTKSYFFHLCRYSTQSNTSCQHFICRLFTESANQWEPCVIQQSRSPWSCDSQRVSIGLRWCSSTQDHYVQCFMDVWMLNLLLACSRIFASLYHANSMCL